MLIDFTTTAQAGVLALASGRVAWALTKDDIFRPVREWIWLRSSPEDSLILKRGEQGDMPQPARMVHRIETEDSRLYRDESGIDRVEFLGTFSSRYEFDPRAPLRKPGFFGMLVECPHCLGFWVSLVAVLAWWALGDTAIRLAFPLAVWAVSSLYAHRLAS